ncbi:MAG: SgcJ/EcaC family oxidoreductase [Pirellulales bacterium]
MQRIMMFWGVLSLSVGLARAADPPSADEQAIRASITSYVAAYNRGDAKAVASHWSENAVWVSPAGQKVQGRAAIEQALTAMFAELKGTKLEIAEPSIRLVTPDVALEEGEVLVLRPEEEPQGASYIAVHVKKDGKWHLDSVRETELPTEAFSRDGLDQLDWLVGEWVDSGAGSTVETKVAWTKNGTFLTMSFRVVTSEDDDLEGTQIIGWDPTSRSIRSWLFDSDGGFGEGTWTRDGKRWVVQATQTLADGRRTSSTNIYQREDDNSYTWQSTERRVDGVAMPDIKPVKVQRAAQAKPAAGADATPPKDVPAGSAKPAGKPGAGTVPPRKK